ncbi:MAG: hypothetical protein R3D71_07790 [Rickettsiales bacterium]
MSANTLKNNLFDEIKNFISDNRNLLAEGSTVKLAGMDKKVHSLCEQVLELSESDRQEYGELLDELLNDLKELSKDMTIQREAMANEIRYLSSHKQANIAYKNVDTKLAPINNDEN